MQVGLPALGAEPLAAHVAVEGGTATDRLHLENLVAPVGGAEHVVLGDLHELLHPPQTEGLKLVRSEDALHIQRVDKFLACLLRAPQWSLHLLLLPKLLDVPGYAGVAEGMLAVKHAVGVTDTPQTKRTLSGLLTG